MFELEMSPDFAPPSHTHFYLYSLPCLVICVWLGYLSFGPDLINKFDFLKSNSVCNYMIKMLTFLDNLKNDDTYDIFYCDLKSHLTYLKLTLK